MAGSERRNEIVKAALELLAEEPPEKLSTRILARRVGVTQPALFRHFRSRDQIMSAVIEESQAELAAIAERVLSEKSSAEDQLRGLVRGLLDHVERNPGLPRLLFADAFPGKGPLRPAIQALVSMQRALVAQIVKQAQAEGAIDGRIDADLAATALIGLVQGVVLQWQLSDRRGPLAARADALMGLWLDGVRLRGEPPAMRKAAEASKPPGRGGLRSIDVRPILASGTDPLDAILSEIEKAGPTGLLRLVAPFRPAPLIALLSKRGCRIDAREISRSVWVVEILAPSAPAILELADLEPPEPLERVLVEAGKLPRGGVLIARLPRFPRLLLPHLAERSLAWESLETEEGPALIRVWKPN